MVRKGSLLLLIQLTALVFSGAPAKGDSVTVGCTGAVGVFDYPSINAALSALHAVSFRDHQITVSGTCSEYVQIDEFENLQLLGTPGTTILDPGTMPEPVLNFNQCENATVEGFTIRGVDQDVDLVRVFNNSDVQFYDCTIERGGSGMFISHSSRATIIRSILQDNGNGIRVASTSNLVIGDVNLQPTPSIVQRSTVNGISVDSNAQAGIWGNTIIRDNGGTGLNILGARARLCCSLGQRQIVNNGSGVLLNQGTIDLIGPTLIEDNQSWGVLLNYGSSARFFGGQTVRGNGGEGIFALRNSSVQLSASEVSGNGGRGLRLRENSSARVRFNTITGNGEEGIHISYLSTMSLFGPNTITDNSGFDVYCTPDSHALGWKEGVGRMACPRFDQSPDPDPGGPPPSE